MSTNSFELVGRVGYLDMKHTQSGTGITTINLGIKNHKKEYENFFIKFIDTQKQNTASEVAESVQKGDYIRVKGALTLNKFTAKDGKEVERIELLGWGFKPVRFNEETKKFEDVEYAPPVEEINDSDLIGEDEIPF